MFFYSIFNPLEQFRIYILYRCFLGDFDISITNSSISLIFILFLLSFLIIVPTKFIPSRFQFIIENLYLFILQIIKRQINNILSFKYFPVIFTTFTFILISNLLGLFPYGFTITGHIILTFQIAFSIFIGINLIGFFNNSFSFLNLFIPSGVPIILFPFLVLIEFISYIIRPFSLSIRLFANMLAGHTLLNIISSFSFLLLKNFVLLSFLPLLFIVFVLVLEFSIAFVQAYIFSILVCIYINDVYNVNH